MIYCLSSTMFLIDKMGYFQNSNFNKCFLLEEDHPLDESHLVAVRGHFHLEVSTKVRQQGELN